MTIRLVPLPEDVSPIDINYENELICSSCSGTKYYQLPPGDWKLVGISDEMTEEEWERVVTSFGKNGYYNYEAGSQYIECLLPTATESGQSLLRSHNITGRAAVMVQNNKNQ